MGRFATSGLANTLIGYAVIYGLMAAGVNPYASNAAGYIVGFTIAFVLHRSWVFRSRTNLRITAPRYIVAVLICYVLNLVGLRLSIELGAPAWAGQIAGGLIYTAALYAVTSLWVFRDDSNQA